MLRVRRFAYNDITGEPDAPGHETVVVTEDDILRDYWPYWTTQMLKRGGRSPLMTVANCIDDFLVVNWAWELTDGETAADSGRSDRDAGNGGGDAGPHHEVS